VLVSFTGGKQGRDGFCNHVSGGRLEKEALKKELGYIYCRNEPNPKLKCRVFPRRKAEWTSGLFRKSGDDGGTGVEKSALVL